MTAFHSATILKANHPKAAWLATISPDDDGEITSAWRSETAAKEWVKARLLEHFGIDRKRLPWKKTNWGIELYWRTSNKWDDDSFLGWGSGDDDL